VKKTIGRKAPKEGAPGSSKERGDEFGDRDFSWWGGKRISRKSISIQNSFLKGKSEGKK